METILLAINVATQEVEYINLKAHGRCLQMLPSEGGYIQEPLVGGKHTTCPSNHCFIVVYSEHETRSATHSTQTLNLQSSPSDCLWFIAKGNVAQTISITSFKPCGTHSAEILCILKFCYNFGALYTQKPLYAQLIPSQFRAYLHQRSVHLRPLVCLCERTQNIQCDAFWKHIWMPLTPLQWSTRLHIALHGTPMHFYSEETLFPYTNTLPIYIFPPQDNIMNAMILASEMCVHSCKYTAIWWWHLQVRATCFQAYTIHFPHYHTFGQKYIFVMTYGMTRVTAAQPVKKFPAFVQPGSSLPRS